MGESFNSFPQLLLESKELNTRPGFLTGCTWEVVPGTSFVKMGLCSSLKSSGNATLYVGCYWIQFAIILFKLAGLKLDFPSNRKSSPCIVVKCQTEKRVVVSVTFRLFFGELHVFCFSHDMNLSIFYDLLGSSKRVSVLWVFPSDTCCPSYSSFSMLD